MSRPDWVVEPNKINEVLFCEDFLDTHPMVSVGGSFFKVDGKVHDGTRLRKIIFDEIKPYVTSGISKKVGNLMDVLRMECCSPNGCPLSGRKTLR